MVKKQRRMTVKKKTTKKPGLAKRSVRGSAKSTKAFKTTKRSPPGRRNADRANQALKTLMKALKQTEDTE